MSTPRHDPSRGWMSAEDLANEALAVTEDRLAEVYAMNRRVRDGLAEMAEAMRLALDDGTSDVLRSALTESITCLMTLINSADASALSLVLDREGDS